MTLEISTMGTGSIWLRNPIQIEGYEDHHYTGVTVIVDAHGSEVLGRGCARRDPHDKYNAEIGRQLALGRALEDAGKRITKRANGLVKPIYAKEFMAATGTPGQRMVFVTPRKGRVTGEHIIWLD